MAELSKQQKIAEFIKCLKDPVYFVNNYAYIFNINTQSISKIKCFEYQEEFIRNLHSNRNNIVLKSRQTGLSVITSCYLAWRLIFKIDERILVVADNGAGAVRFLAHIRNVLDNLPEFLLPNQRITDNTKQIAFSNGSWVKAVASSPQAGRGETLTMLVLDETAFIEHADDIWAGAGIALAASGGKCVMISTPYGAKGLYYKTWQAAEKGEGNKEELFFPTKIHWSQHPIFSKGMEKRVDETGKEALWSQWYEDQCAKLHNDKVKIAQELDLSFEGSGANVIDADVLSVYEKDVLNKTILCYYNYKLDTLESRFTNAPNKFRVWEKPIEGTNYLVSCLPEGEMVLTNNGLKKIESVTFDDLLYDRDGKLTKIKNVQINNVDDDVCEIKVANIFRTTTFTKNHPILACNEYELKRNWNKNNEQYAFRERYWDLDFKFIEAEKIKKNDWLIYPNIYKNNILSEEEIIQKWDKYKHANRIDFTIDCPLLDEEFWWYIGIWLAEGWTYFNKKYSKNVYTVHNIKTEYHYVERIVNLWKRYDRRVLVQKKDTVFQIQFNSTQIFDFLDDNFGKGALNKKLPEWVKFLPDKLKIKMVEGYLNGDGCWLKNQKIRNKNGESKMAFVSISLELLEGIQDILFSIGILSTLQMLRKEGITVFRNKEYKTKETYELNLNHYDSIKFAEILGYKHDFVLKNKRIIKNSFFSKDFNFIYLRVSENSLKNYKGAVYNFETESHTFLCRNITTHNCDVARGDGSDYSTIQILNADTLTQVAEYQDRLSPDEFARVIYNVAKDYNNAYVAVECNSFGLATTLMLKNQLGYKANRMYHSKSAVDLFDRHTPYKFNASKGSDVPGFQTTTTTRPLVVNAIIKYMNSKQIKINSSRLLEEFKTFVYTGGKAQHADGYHDDLIIAFGIGLLIRDTEIENVFWSKNSTKALLNNIHVSSKSFSSGELTQGQKKPYEDDDDLNDTSWLFAPVKG